MADSIKISFLPETVSEGGELQNVRFYNTGNPSFSEIKSFFQDITHVLTQEEAETGDNNILANIPHYETIVKATENQVSTSRSAEYSVIDMSQVGMNSTQIIITNNWEMAGSDPDGFFSLFVKMNPEPNGQDGYLAIDQVSPSITKIEITFCKNGDSKKVSEPEVYPSVARSLDKLVDKMEGNTVEVPGDKKIFETGFSYTTTHQTIDSEDGPSIFVKLEGTLDDLPEWTEQECTVQLLHSGEVIKSQLMALSTEHVPMGSDDVEYAVTEYYAGTNPLSDYFKIVLSVLDGEGNPPTTLGAKYQKRVIMAKGTSLSFFSDIPESDKGNSHPSDYTIRFVGGAVPKTVPAYETYKEAVPSIEQSMWKIAELYGANKDSITLGNTTLTESDLAKLLSIINDEDEGADTPIGV